MSVKILKARVEDELHKQLSSLGMQRHGTAVFTLGLDSRTLGSISLNWSAASPGAVDVNPVVGISDEVLERHVADLEERKFKQYGVATVSSNLGQLPVERVHESPIIWTFTSDSSLAVQVRLLAADIEETALPFMRANGNLRQITTLLERGIAWPPSINRRLPVAYALIGRNRDAEAHIARSLERLEGYQDSGANSFRIFARRFLDALSQGAFTGQPAAAVTNGKVRASKDRRSRPTAPPAKVRVAVKREVLHEFLRAYGEDELANAALHTSDAELQRIGDTAWRILEDHGDKRPRLVLAKALAMAAVATLEGAPRQLRWARRRRK